MQGDETTPSPGESWFHPKVRPQEAAGLLGDQLWIFIPCFKVFASSLEVIAVECTISRNSQPTGRLELRSVSLG